MKGHKPRRYLLLVGLAVLFIAGFTAAASPHNALGIFTASTGNSGNGHGTLNGDTDTSSECPPGYGGDPCVHNGNSAPGTDKGHGNCEDNQGKGNNGNDNGNDRPGCTTTTTPETCPPGTTGTPPNYTPTTTTGEQCPPGTSGTPPNCTSTTTTTVKPPPTTTTPPPTTTSTTPGTTTAPP